MRDEIQVINDIWFEKKGARFDKLQRICNLNPSRDSYNKFLDQIVFYECIRSEGGCEKLWEDLKPFPKIYCNKAHFDFEVSKEKEFVANLMMGRDQLVYDRWDIDVFEIPEKQLHLEQLKPSVIEKGVHIIHGKVASGKGKNVVLPDIARYAGNARMLVVSPNKQDVYDMCKELGVGWHHYHHYGETADDVRRAIRDFDKLCICAASLSKFEDYPELQRFDVIYVDEITQIIMTYQLSKNVTFSKSIETLYLLISKSLRSLLLSADITERNSLDVLGRLASDSNQKIRYYKNTIDYAEGMIFTYFGTEFEAVWETAKRINGGQRCFGAVDFANRPDDKTGEVMPRLNNFIRMLKELCPDAKIQAFDSTRLRDHPDGKWIRANGLQAYIEKETDAERLDAIFITNWAKSNVSVIFENEDRYGFDFTCGIHRGVNNAWDSFQACRRVRQTATHLIYVNNPKGTAMVSEDSGKRAMPKVADEMSLKRAEPEERANYYGKIAVYQQEAQNNANRRWLSKLIVESRGGVILSPGQGPDNDSARFLSFRNRYLKEVLSVSGENKAWESEAFARHRLLDQFSEYDPHHKKIRQITDEQGIDYDQLKAKEYSISVECAETICRILDADETLREEWDEGILDAFYKETGQLLDRILLKLPNIGSFYNLARWYLTSPNGSTYYYILPEKEKDEINDLINRNYKDIYQPTLKSSEKSCRTLQNLLPKIIGEHLELEIWGEKKHKVMEYKSAHISQFLKSHPTLIKKANGVNKNWATIGEILRDQIQTDQGIKKLTELDKKHLDMFADVIKIKRPERPLFNRIVSLYSKVEFHEWDKEKTFDSPMSEFPYHTSRTYITSQEHGNLQN